MMLTTKQVRAIAKAAGFATATYLEKTSDEQRRSVVWQLNATDAANLEAAFKAQFAQLGATNTVKRTGVVTWCNYVRVMAHIA